MADSPKRSYKDRERQRREDDIIRAAAQMLQERGYANLNMDELADMVGVSKPTLYAHFKSKDDLVVQVIVHNFHMVDDYLAQSPQGTVLDQLAAILRLMIKTKRAPGHLLGAPNSELMRMLHTHPILEAHRRSIDGALHALVEEGKANGEITPDLPTNMIVRALFCLQGVVGGPPEMRLVPDDEAALDQATDHLIRLFLHGITRNKSGPEDVYPQGQT